MSRGRWQTLSRVAPGIALAALVLLGYGRFVNEYFQGGDTWPHIWTTRSDPLHVLAEPIMAGTVFPQTVALFFRPLSSLSYAFNYALGGMNPQVFHATDLLIHLAATLMLYALAGTLGLRRWPAAFGAAIFALHPVMASVVPNLPRRHDPLAALGVFAALTLAARAIDARPARAWRYTGAAALCLALAELSKEVAYLGVLLAVPTLLVAAANSKAGIRHSLGRIAVIIGSLAAISVVMLAWHWRVVGGLGGYYDQPPLGNFDVALNDLLQNLLFPFAPWLGKTLRAWFNEIGLAVALTIVPAILAEGRTRRVILLGWVWLLLGVVFQMLTRSLAAWQTYLTLASSALLIGGVLDAATQRNLPVLKRAALSLSALGVVVFSAGVVSSSVLVRPFAEWHIAGEVARMYLGSLRPCLEAAPAGMRIELAHVPDSVDDSTPERVLIHPAILGPYSVGPAVELVLPDLPPRDIGVQDLRQVGSIPRSITSQCAEEKGVWRISSDFES